MELEKNEKKICLPRVYFITHRNERFTYLDSARLALDSGIRLIQLRMKDANKEEIKSTAEELQTICNSYNATLILDDHVEIVRELNLDGVHLGLKDMPIKEAKCILNSCQITGATANEYRHISSAFEQGADYIGLGPFRFTRTKSNLSPVLGLESSEKILSQCRANNINLPIYAIGGIEIRDIESLVNAGFYGIAVSSLILDSEHPADTARRVVGIFNE